MTQSQESIPNHQWHLDVSDPEKSSILREAWAEVTDPELSFSIVQLGMIRDVEIHDGKVLVKMILTTPFCPYGPALLEKTRRTAEKALSLPVTMEMGTEPWDPSMMDEDASASWGMLY